MESEKKLKLELTRRKLLERLSQFREESSRRSNCPAEIKFTHGDLIEITDFLRDIEGLLII